MLIAKPLGSRLGRVTSNSVHFAHIIRKSFGGLQSGKVSSNHTLELRGDHFDLIAFWPAEATS
jgi:hypothetical protein